MTVIHPGGKSWRHGNKPPWMATPLCRLLQPGGRRQRSRLSKKPFFTR
jgi:hypothetical protein